MIRLNLFMIWFFALSFLIISYLHVLSSKFIKSNHCCFSIYSFHAFLFIDLSVQGHVGELFDNQMKINKQLYQLLYSHLNLAIIMRIKRISFLCSFIIFFSTMFIGCGRKKQQNIPVNATVKSFNPISVNIYIENSGSMAGYCNMRDIS